MINRSALSAPITPAQEVPAGAPTPAPLDTPTFTSAHNALLSDSSIQFDLPMRPPPPPPPPRDPPPGWLQWLADFFSADHPILRWLLWGVAALFAAWILWLLARRLMGADWPWRRGAGTSEADESWRPEEAQARTLLGQADALAAAGRYSEAAHLLLFRSIEDVDERRPDVIRKSLTARDIAGLPALPDRPRSAFVRIALAVERAFFARRDLGESEWKACRAAYEEFAFAEAWA